MKIILSETLAKKGKSQYWLAKETGIAASTINNLCNNKTTSIQFSLLQKICDALDCNVGDIIQAEPVTLPLISFDKQKDDSE